MASPNARLSEARHRRRRALKRNEPGLDGARWHRPGHPHRPEANPAGPPCANQDHAYPTPIALRRGLRQNVAARLPTVGDCQLVRQGLEAAGAAAGRLGPASLVRWMSPRSTRHRPCPRFAQTPRFSKAGRPDPKITIGLPDPPHRVPADGRGVHGHRAPTATMLPALTDLAAGVQKIPGSTTSL